MKVVPALVFASFLLSQMGTATAEPKPATSIPAGDQMQPADLAAILANKIAPKPLILQVGFQTLYAQAHIPDSEYVGAASEDAGLKRLHIRVAKLSKDTLIIIYCGCCPWSHCPNIAAAYDALQGLGFSQVKALYIADNFGDDWVHRGFPVTKGHQ